jgi:hypothetical protein
VSGLKTFGCAASVLIPDKKRQKFESVNETGIFIGYLPHPRAWRVLVLCEERLVVRESATLIAIGIPDISPVLCTVRAF